MQPGHYASKDFKVLLHTKAAVAGRQQPLLYVWMPDRCGMTPESRELFFEPFCDGTEKFFGRYRLHGVTGLHKTYQVLGHFPCVQGI